MAIVYTATLVPSKPELIAAWLPLQPWYSEPSGGIELLGAFRFDDPYGEVGIETHLVRGPSGAVYQVPLTYRAGAMPDAGRYLVAELEHSVLGHRWVYDATADPVGVAQLAGAILTGGREAEVFVDGAEAPAEPDIRVRGTGTSARAPQATLVGVQTEGAITRVRTDSVAIDVRRIVDGLGGTGLRLDAVEGLPGGPATLAAVVSV